MELVNLMEVKFFRKLYILYLDYVPVSRTSEEISEDDLTKNQMTREGRALRMNHQYKILNKKLLI